MRLERWMETGIDLVYPPRCPFCGTIISSRWELLCPECRDREKEILRRPARIDREKHYYYCIESAAALYRYHHPLVQKGILRMKSSEPWYAAGFARLMAVRLYGYEPAQGKSLLDLSLEYGCIVPVPDSKTGRGYWVTGLMARELGRLVGLPVETKALKKARSTVRQAGLDREERLTNLIGAFEVISPEKVEGKKILLLDDIMTTGSTVSCCAQTLLEAGAASVCAICLAVSEQE